MCELILQQKIVLNPELLNSTVRSRMREGRPKGSGTNPDPGVKINNSDLR